MHTDNICGAYHQITHGIVLLIEGETAYEQHIYETVCHMTNVTIPQKFEFSK